MSADVEKMYLQFDLTGKNQEKVFGAAFCFAQDLREKGRQPVSEFSSVTRDGVQHSILCEFDAAFVNASKSFIGSEFDYQGVPLKVSTVKPRFLSSQPVR